MLFGGPGTTADIAKEAASTVLKELHEGERYPDCSSIWRLHMAAVWEFSEYNDRLVDIIVELQRLPDADGLSASLPHSSEYWAQFDLGTTYCGPYEEYDKEHEIQARLNGAAFHAKLSTRGTPFEHILNRGAISFRNTCEIAGWENFHYPAMAKYYNQFDDEDDYRRFRDNELEYADIQTLNQLIPITAVWLKYAGKDILNQEGEFHPQEHTLQRGKWMVPTGYSTERFGYWRERFEWMSKVTALEMSTRKMAETCAKAMAKIEQEA